ncbi:MAG: rRNA pseudouridine synthase [Cytophagales bacterium]|nr:rRNA pseudouridine synthase [Cytophagales bacterium]
MDKPKRKPAQPRRKFKDAPPKSKNQESPNPRTPNPKYKQPDESKIVSSDMRLNRFISNAGVCSRREADVLIEDGKITVNGKKVVEMGVKVKPTDTVKHEGKILTTEKLQYVLLNKPKGFITTMKDERDRKTVMSLVEKACTERIYPVGRLDRQTTGLLLFTNDGDLAKKLMHPSHRIKKIYQIGLDKSLAQKDYDAIVEGLTLEDGPIKVDELAVLSDDNMNLGIEIHSGRNRIIRRIFEHLGYRVETLDRVMYGRLTKKNLGRGKWRKLTDQEVSRVG